MRRKALPLLLLLVFVVGVPGADAATRSVFIVNDPSDFGAFDPPGVTAVQGDTVSWTNGTDQSHTSTGNSPLSLWDSEFLGPGQKYEFVFTTAGRYRYYCRIHPSMTGVVRVPIERAPSSGPVGTRFAIRVSSVVAAEPFVYDIQRKIGSGEWTLWKTLVDRKAVSFTPRSAGTYFFRARLRDTGKNPDASSGWSAAKGITVKAS